MIKETGYEKIKHAVFFGDSKVSKEYSCKVDAEISMQQFKRNSIFNGATFNVRQV